MDLPKRHRTHRVKKETYELFPQGRPWEPALLLESPDPCPKKQEPERASGNRKAIPNWYCKFCRKNGEKPEVFASHTLKDAFGRVTCPVLRAYVCPYCEATGESAHTRKYCPMWRRGTSPPCFRPLLRAGRCPSEPDQEGLRCLCLDLPKNLQ